MTHTNTEALSDAERLLGRVAAEIQQRLADAIYGPGQKRTESVSELIDVLIALSRRAANSAGRVEVKALEWSAFNADWHAYSVAGEYSVGLVGGNWLAILRHYHDGEEIDETIGGFGDADSAKAAAQADFNQRILSALTPAVEAEPVAPAERLKLHRKIMGMIADKQRYAGVMIDGRELRVIAEALLDRAIEVERSSPVSAEVTVTDEPKRVPHEVALAGFYEAQKVEVKAKPLYDQCCAIYQAMRTAALNGGGRMGDLKELVERLGAAIDLGTQIGARGKNPTNIYNIADEAATALTSLIAERDGLREALNNLETANRALCEKRSQATYDSMIDNDRAADELIALDHARLSARTALSLETNKGDGV